jgi:hypothetical protein
MQIQNNLTFQKKSPSFSALIIENPRGTRYINSLNMDELKFLEECGKKLEKTKHVDVFIGSKDFSSSVGIKEKSGLNIYDIINNNFKQLKQNICIEYNQSRRSQKDKDNNKDFDRPSRQLFRFPVDKLSISKFKTMNRTEKMNELFAATELALNLEKEIEEKELETKKRLGDSPERNELINKILLKYSKNLY